MFLGGLSGAIFADQPDVPDRTAIFMYHAVDDEVLEGEVFEPGEEPAPDVARDRTRAGARIADRYRSETGERPQASVVFTVPVGERLDTPERLAVISDTVSNVYDLEKVVNPLDAALGAAITLNEVADDAVTDTAITMVRNAASRLAGGSLAPILR